MKLLLSEEYTPFNGKTTYTIDLIRESLVATTLANPFKSVFVNVLYYTPSILFASPTESLIINVLYSID